MLSFKEALEMVRNSCPENVVKHCLLVSKKSFGIAERIKNNGIKIDAELCRVGGLIHDIGRSKTHGLNHGIVGAEILKNHPLLSGIAKTHVGGGILKIEAKGLGLGNESLMPKSLEEKVVCYADKLVQGDEFVSDASFEIKKLENKLGKEHASIKRLKRLEKEIKKIIG